MTLKVVPRDPQRPDGRDTSAIPGYNPYPYPIGPPDDEYRRALEEWKRNHPPAELPDFEPFENEFFTNVQLKERGWTRALRERFLGEVDQRLPVDHWKNWYGKDAYTVRRVELTEITPEWEAAFLRSARRRKLPQALVDEVLQRINENRAAGIDKVIENVDFAWARIERVASDAAAMLAQGRPRGWPHKC